ncbi:MAG TPA: glycoside hydrolase family 3 C-terminal domain-containing protein [Chloroflexia bacterium]|nr:glycoside hydrolase family 3 C-terminal domain-containing protein [Chloroflexia bacterium]
MKFCERVQELLDALTLEEKVSMLAGASIWNTVPVERLGIPAIKVTDGPNGARGDSLFGSGKGAACLPCGIALASTWNPDLVKEVGQVLGEEALSKGAKVLLAPTINIQRSPLNGRNFECYSEDPYLAARMAVAYIEGVQSRGVGNSVKHFAGNNSEFERNTISSEIGERALREIYLPAFEAAVREAGSWTVMASYNRLNGTYSSDNHMLLTDILKGEWGFEGVVMSDWFGTHSTAPALNAGLDLEMPGPTQWRGQKLVQAVQKGEVTQEAITEAAGRVLHLLERVGAFEHPEIAEEQDIDLPEHRAVARRSAAEGIVLLRNEGNVLPLDPTTTGRIAIIGPNAKTAQIMGGGSARVNAHYAITPFEGITAQLGPGVKVGYELGCTNHKYTPLLPVTRLEVTRGSGQSGLAIDYYYSPDLSGEPVWHTTLTGTEQVWLGQIGHGVDPRAFSARISGSYTPEETGDHIISITSSGLSRLYIDGSLAIDNWTSQTSGDSFMGAGSAEKVTRIALTADTLVELVIEYSTQGAGFLSGVRLGAMRVLADDAIDRAAKLAAASDVALVFVGSTGEWESEGADRHDMDLVGRQSELIEAVAAANPRTVVVVQTGSPVTMPWLDTVAAVLEAWFPGQECGNAIADVLFGKVDASGRLPQTFPQRLQDNPAFINYPGENGKVVYGEGIFVGYRYYDKKAIAPLFPFGFGLSYTTFEYSNMYLSESTMASDETLQVSMDVRNTGARAGMEVVQLYVEDMHASLMRPNMELKGFAKVALAPGETRTVTFTLDRRALAYWDDAEHRWTAEAGDFRTLVGRSAEEIVLAARFTLRDTVRFDGPGRAAQRLTVQSTVRDLLANEEARSILERYVPGFSSNPQLGFALGLSLEQVAGFDAQIFNEQTMQNIEAGLEKLSESALATR